MWNGSAYNLNHNRKKLTCFEQAGFFFILFGLQKLR